MIVPAVKDGGSSYCGPVSLSAITGHTTKRICYTLRMRFGYRRVCGVSRKHMLWYLQCYKFGLLRLPIERCNLRRFADYHQRKGRIYLVELSDHFVVLYDNNIVCTSTGGKLQPIAANRYLRKFVVAVWIVSLPGYLKRERKPVSAECGEN